MLCTFLVFLLLPSLVTPFTRRVQNTKTIRRHSFRSEVANLEFLSLTIAAISKQVNAELHLYVNLNETETDETLKLLLLPHGTKNVVPQLIVTQDTNATKFEIRGNFTSKVLTIAFVNTSNMLAVRQKVNQLLWELHFRDVLFVFNDNVNVRILHKLFNACWRNGFIMAAALTATGSLYTYHPFPKLSVVLLPHVAAYADKSALLNFHGYRLRAPISGSSPRCYRYVDRKGNNATGGYFYKIVLTFLNHHNGTFEEVVMPTYNVNYTDILKAFKAGKIDIVPNLYYMNRAYSHSDVMLNYNVYVIAPFAKSIPESYYFIKPFKRNVWALLLGMLTYVVLLLSLIYWRQRGRLDFSATMLEVIKMLLFLPHYTRRLRTRLQLLIFAMLLLTGFLLTNFYLAKLSSLLATKVYGDQIKSFDDVAKTKLLIPQTKFDRKYLNEISRIHPAILQRISMTTSERVHNLRRDLNTSYLHLAVEDKIRFILYQQKFLKVPLFRRIDEILFSLPIFVPVPHGSPFLPLLNRFLLLINQAGIWQKLVNDNEQDGILSGEIRFFCGDSNHQSSLTVKHFALALALWAVGLLSASCVFICEILLFEKRIFRTI